jgi:hypothetical protein
MPYIITTKCCGRPRHHAVHKDLALGHAVSVSRRAVATWTEARDEVMRIEAERDPTRTYGPGTHGWPKPPGTYGPLPDGTVIEVERVTAEV